MNDDDVAAILARAPLIEMPADVRRRLSRVIATEVALRTGEVAATDDGLNHLDASQMMTALQLAAERDDVHDETPESLAEDLGAEPDSVEIERMPHGYDTEADAGEVELASPASPE